MTAARCSLLLAALGLGTLASTCDGAAPGACDGLSCSGHGYCVAVADMPYCVCAAGYHPVGGACEPNAVANPCEGIDCDGHGSCGVQDEAPVCDCAPGFEPLGELHCVPEPRPDAGNDDAAGDEATGETTDEAADEATETPAPRCGDSIVQTGEECDDANAADDDACLSSCRNAGCGDGVVWSGVEECEGADWQYCSSSCGTEGLQFCEGCVWGTDCQVPDEECNGIDDDCDGTTDEGGCAWDQYCLEASCWTVPSFEQGPACADLGVAHPPPDVLSYYQVRGRPGAQVHKWNRHVSCPGAVAGEAPETAAPADERIGADGNYRFTIETGSPITDCVHEALGEWESWVIIDGFESNHVRSTYYNSLCGGVQTCDLASAYCPP
jgi:cysteine-rich repeat protein